MDMNAIREIVSNCGGSYMFAFGMEYGAKVKKAAILWLDEHPDFVMKVGSASAGDELIHVTRVFTAADLVRPSNGVYLYTFIRSYFLKEDFI